MDVVYILGKGSEANNQEIVYSLRSLCINMLDLRNVYVVGDCPDFLTDIRHIACEDSHDKKWKNALEKTRIAATTDGITDEFLLMNDDFFALEPFMGAELPFYAVKNGNGGCNGRNDFQVHLPIRLNKEWYEKMPLSLEMKGDWSPRSFYCNFYGAPPTYIDDPIVRVGNNLPDFDTQIKNKGFFSISNSAMHSAEFMLWLHDLYPDPCKFEISC